MQRMIRIGWTMGIVLLSLPFCFSSAVPQIYRWTDEKGTVHYSDNPSTLPKDYSEGNKRVDEKKDAEKKVTAAGGKATSEKGSIAPSRAAKPAGTIGAAPAQPPELMPPEPVKPADQGMVFGQIKSAEENAPQQIGPGGQNLADQSGAEQKAPGKQKVQFGTVPKSPPAMPGDPGKMFGRKTTYTIGAVVGGLGIVISAVGGIWFLVAAFKVSVLWGLLCLFVPLAQIVFLITHWKEVRKPFAICLLSMGLLFAAAFLMVEHPLLLLRHYTQ